MHSPVFERSTDQKRRPKNLRNTLVSTKNSPSLYSAICTIGERRLTIQFYSDSFDEVPLRCLDLIKRHHLDFFSRAKVDELERDFVGRIVEPTPVDGVNSVWACSDAVGGVLIDLLFVATSA